MMMRKCRVHLFGVSRRIPGGGCDVLVDRVGLRLSWDACKEIAHKNSIKIAIYVRERRERVAESMRKLMWLLL